jgi:F0F1-type ATP synthase epsilon subunit
MVAGILNGTQIISVLAGCIAAGLIFMVERSIIMSNGSKPVLFFRIALGFLIALLGSITLDEVIFKKDIDKQMAKNKEIQNKREVESVNQSFAERLARQEALVMAKYNTWIQSLQNASKEADGTSGSGKRGVHAITQLKISIAEQNKQDYIKAKEDLEKLRANVESDASKALVKVNESFDNNALLERIKAMFDLVWSNGWMMSVYIIVTLLLFFLEFIVVILKMYLPKSNYEYKLEIIEEIGKRRLDQFKNHDINNYDHSRHNPIVRNANNKVKKISNSSLFN